MKRKLIDLEVFKNIEKGSVTNAEYELTEAQDVLAQMLGVQEAKLHCLNEAVAYFQTGNNTFVKTSYNVNESAVTFNDIEEVVIDEETVNNECRGLISKMVDAILEDKTQEANEFFHQYLEARKMSKKCSSCDMKEAADPNKRAVRPKRKVNPVTGKQEIVGYEANPHRFDPSSKKNKAPRGPAAAHKSHVTRSKNAKAHKGFASPMLKADKNRKQKALGVGSKMVKEWYTVAENVLNYIDFIDAAPVLSESLAKHDKDGNVVAVKVPTSKVRNEGKILSLQYKTLKTDVKVLREAARKLFDDYNFCNAVAEVKKYNNLSDNNQLEESIHTLVNKYPSVLYLTQEELSKVVGNALHSVGSSNFDDQTCAFIAEGILRVAHQNYPERVSRIAQLANVKVEQTEDAYADFQNVVGQFYPSLDESTSLEMQVFVDLHSAVNEVRKLAAGKNKEVHEESAELLTGLEDILNGNTEPCLDVAAETANWLADLAETNLESQAWDVVKKPYHTVTGDHPDMAKKAAQGYAPSKDFSGDWGDPAPMIGSDKMSYKGGEAEKARKNAWGNWGGKETFPTLDNPYVPKPFGDYTMNGEKGVDKDVENSVGMWQTGDTWPNLQNPYVPKSVRVHVNSDNRVDDVVSDD